MLPEILIFANTNEQATTRATAHNIGHFQWMNHCNPELPPQEYLYGDYTVIVLKTPVE